MNYPKVEIESLKSVLKTIVFFDALDKKVSKDEIALYNLETLCNIESIEISLAVLEELEIIQQQGEYYQLYARKEKTLSTFNTAAKLSFWQKTILNTLHLSKYVRGVYHLNLIGERPYLVIDLSGLNKPKTATLVCDAVKSLTGFNCLYVSRFKKTSNLTNVSNLFLASLKPLFQPLALEKLINRSGASVGLFPNKTMDYSMLLKPMFSVAKRRIKKPVFKVQEGSDKEFFNFIDKIILEHDLNEKWETNQKIYEQWLLPKLKGLHRKYHLV